MKLTATFTSALLFLAASADLVCEDFPYGDSGTNKGYMVLNGANLTVGNKQAKNLHVAQGKAKNKNAYALGLRNCSSASLQLLTCIQPMSSGNIWYKTYTTAVEVIDPRSGYCMTRPNNTDGTVNFQRCVVDPQGRTQLWGFSQDIYPDKIYPPRIYPLEYAAWKVANTTWETIYLDFDSGPDPTFMTFNATGVVPYSQDVQQCRV